MQQKNDENELFQVVNTWDGSSEIIGTAEECKEFIANMAEFTTQTFIIKPY